MGRGRRGTQWEHRQNSAVGVGWMAAGKLRGLLDTRGGGGVPGARHTERRLTRRAAEVLSHGGDGLWLYVCVCVRGGGAQGEVPQRSGV
jgi:hypothetical protein